jgi:hypothetical protein
MNQVICRWIILGLSLSPIGCTDKSATSASSTSAPTSSSAAPTRPHHPDPDLIAPPKTAGVTGAKVSLFNPHAGAGAPPIEIAFAAHEARQLEETLIGLRKGTRMHGDIGFIPIAKVELKYDDGSVERITTDFKCWKDSEERVEFVRKNGKQIIADKLGHIDPKTRAQLLKLLDVEYKSAPSAEL